MGPRRRSTGGPLAAAVSLAGIALGISVACGPGSIGDLTAGRRDGGADAKVCDNAVAPSRPAPSTDGRSIEDLTFAADDMRVENGEAPASALPPPKGLDLDLSCGCDEPPTCVRLVDSGLAACDDPQGRDNEAARQLANLALVFDLFRPTFLRERIHDGAFSVLFTLQKWNGKEDDPEVLVSIRPSVGTTAGPDGVRPRPKFDGNDEWDLDPGSLSNGQSYVGRRCDEADVPCTALALDTTAYVRGGTLVATFKDVALRITSTSGNFEFPFRGATVFAKITGGPGTWRIAGEMVGRFPVDRLLTIAGSAEFNDQSLCRSPQYAGFKDALCGAADIAADPSNDRKGRPCDGLSGGLSFTASPARIGGVRASSQLTGECTGFTDTCSKK